MSQVAVVGKVEVQLSKPTPKAEDPAKAWYPMGTILPYSFEEVFEGLRELVPAKFGSEMALVEKHGPGTRRMRHFRSYTLLVEQPTAGQFRGEGKKADDKRPGRDGRVTLTFTNGPEGARRKREFSLRLPRRYAEGGDLDV